MPWTTPESESPICLVYLLIFVYAAVYAGGFFKAEKCKKPLRSAVLFSGCPLYPRKRTFAVHQPMSALGQMRMFFWHPQWNTEERALRLSSADVRLLMFLPYDLARLSGEPGLFPRPRCISANPKPYPLWVKSRREKGNRQPVKTLI